MLQVTYRSYSKNADNRKKHPKSSSDETIRTDRKAKRAETFGDKPTDMPDWLKILIPSLVGLATTICAAFLSARWATRRAFQERWWEKKERAYSDVVEALHDAIRYCDMTADEYLNNRESSHPKKKEFGDRYNEAYWKIQKATDIGAFIISEKAAAALTDLRKRPRLKWEESPPWEIYEQEAEYYREALQKMRDCAKQDLNV